MWIDCMSAGKMEEEDYDKQKWHTKSESRVQLSKLNDNKINNNNNSLMGDDNNQNDDNNIELSLLSSSTNNSQSEIPVIKISKTESDEILLKKIDDDDDDNNFFLGKYEKGKFKKLVEKFIEISKREKFFNAKKKYQNLYDKPVV